MKNIIALILLQFILCDAISAQRDYSPKRYNSLTGEIHMFTLFVETANGNFEDEEIDYLLEELESSLNWLEDQAESYNKELEFSNDYFSHNINEVVYIDRIMRGNPKHTVNMIIEELGYDDIADFFEWSDFDYNTDKFKMLLFVKDMGRSHAYQIASTDQIDLAIVYCKNPYSLKRVGSTISHEILHQFGAWDLYHEEGRSQTEETIQIIREKYSNSIMLTTRNSDEIIVDEVTASLVGWAEFKPEYRIFNRLNNKDEIIKEGRKKRREKANIKFDLKGTEEKK